MRLNEIHTRQTSFKDASYGSVYVISLYILVSISYIKMINETAMDSTGILHLEIVQQFFNKMKIPLDQVKVKGDFFNFDDPVEETRNCFNWII